MTAGPVRQDGPEPEHQPERQGGPSQQVVLRPRSLLEIGDLASRFVQAHLHAFAWLLPLCLLPALAGVALLQLGAPPQACWTVAIGLGPVTAAAATVLCAELMLQPQAGTRAVAKRWLQALPRLLWARVLDVASKGLTLGFAFRWTAFLPEVVLLEQGDFSAVTRRTGSLLGVVGGRWLGLGLMCLISQLVGVWAGEVAWQALRWMFALSHDSPGLFAHGVSWPALLGLGIAQTYVAVLRFLVYIDCRTRREGWDLAVQMTGLVEAARRQAAVRGAS